METLYVEGVATHDGPESCVAVCEGGGEALTGVRAGRVLSREINLVRGADPLMMWGRQQPAVRKGKARWYPARSETPGMHGNNLRENREILQPPKQARLGRIEKSKDVRR